MIINIGYNIMRYFKIFLFSFCLLTTPALAQVAHIGLQDNADCSGNDTDGWSCSLSPGETLSLTFIELPNSDLEDGYQVLIPLTVTPSASGSFSSNSDFSIAAASPTIQFTTPLTGTIPITASASATNPTITVSLDSGRSTLINTTPGQVGGGSVPPIQSSDSTFPTIQFTIVTNTISIHATTVSTMDSQTDPDTVSIQENDQLSLTFSLPQGVNGSDFSPSPVIMVSSEEVSADSGVDYTAVSASVTLSGNNNDDSPLTVSLIEDEIVETAEDFRLVFTVQNAFTLNVTSILVTIQDNDVATISLSFSTSQGSLMTSSSGVTVQESSQTLTATYTLSPAIAFDVSLSLQITDVTAGQTADYEVDATSVSFTSSTATQTQSVVFTIIEDQLLEDDETFIVETEFLNLMMSLICSAAEDLGCVKLDVMTQTITIVDADYIRVRFSPDQREATETDIFEVKIVLESSIAPSSLMSAAFTLTTALDTNGSSPASEDDFTHLTSEAIAVTVADLSAGERNVPVTITDDQIVEDNETFIIRFGTATDPVSGFDNVSIVPDAPTAITLTIADTDTSTLTFSPSAPITVAEGSAVSLTLNHSPGVTASRSLSVNLIVKLTNIGGGFAADEDLTSSLEEQVVTLQAGASASNAFILSALDDPLLEGPETFTVDVLTTPSDYPGRITLSQEPLQGQIVDNERLDLGFTVSALSADEGNGVQSAAFNFNQNSVSLSPQVQVKATISSQAETANAQDFTFADSSFTFVSDSAAEQSIYFNILSDSLVEGNETFRLTSSVVLIQQNLLSANTVDDDSFLNFSFREIPITIVDDDRATVSLQAVPQLSLTEQDTAMTIQARLDNPVAYPVEISIGVGGGDASIGQDFTLTDGGSKSFQSLALSPDQSDLSLAIIDDTVVENDETIAISASDLTVDGDTALACQTSSQSGCVALGETITVTIQDQDAIEILLTLPSESLIEGATLTPNVSIPTVFAPGVQVSADLTTRDGTAQAASDYAPLSQTLTFSNNTAQNAVPSLLSTLPTLVTHDDTLLETTESVSVALLSDDSRFSVSLPEQELMIEDNESAVVQFATQTLSVTEGDGNEFASVSLSSPGGATRLDGGITIEAAVILATPPGSASLNQDYAFEAQTVTFSSSSDLPLSEIVTLNVLEDMTTEVSETILLVIDSVSGAVNDQAVDLNVTIEQSTLTITIEDNDMALISVIVGNTLLEQEMETWTLAEEDGGGNENVFAFRLAAPSDIEREQDLRVDFTTTSQTALFGVQGDLGRDYYYQGTMMSLELEKASTDTQAIDGTRYDVSPLASFGITNDTIVEDDETFLVTLSPINWPQGVVLRTTSLTVTVTDADQVTVSVPFDTLSIQEAADQVTTSTVALTLSAAIRISVSVSLRLEEGTALAGVDFTPLEDDGRIILNETPSSAMVDLSVVSDDVVELDETFTVILESSDPRVIIGQENQIAVTILPDPSDQAVISLIAPERISESRTVSVVASLSQEVSPMIAEQISLLLSTQDGTVSNEMTVPARGGESLDNVNYANNYDYQPLVDASLQFVAQTTPAEVILYNDNWIEKNENFVLTLTSQSPLPASVTFDGGGTGLSQTVTIVDDDFDPEGLIRFDISDSALIEGQTASISITLSGNWTFWPAVLFDVPTIDVFFAHQQVGITENFVDFDTDFSVFPETNLRPLEGSAGNEYAYNIQPFLQEAIEGEGYAKDPTYSFEIAILDDTIVEPAVERFKLAYGVLDDEYGFSFDVSVTDNDQSAITVSAPELEEGMGTATLEVSLSRPFSRELDLGFQITDETADSQDYTLETSTVTLAAMETTAFVNLAVTEDAIVETSETFLFGINIALPNGFDSNSLDYTPTSFAIADNDVAQLTLSIVDFAVSPTEITRVSESGGSQEARVRVAVDDTTPLGSGIEVAAALSTSDGTALADKDYTPITARRVVLSDTVGVEFVPLSIHEDAFLEGDETLTIRLSALQGEAVDSATQAFTTGQTLTIEDNDRVSLEFTSPTYVFNEGEGEVMVSAGVTGAVSLGENTEIAVTVAAEAESVAMVDQRYTFSAERWSVTFSGQGATLVSIPLTLINDQIAQNTETLVLGLRVHSVTLSDGQTYLYATHQTLIDGLFSSINAALLDTTTLSILDNETLSLGFAQSLYRFTETDQAATASVSYVLSDNQTLSQAIALSLTATSDADPQTVDARANDDYTLLSSVMFAPGGSLQTLATFSLIGDALVETTEVFILTLEIDGSSVDGVILGLSQATVVIEDDDQARLSFSIMDDEGDLLNTIEEDGQSVQIEVTLASGVSLDPEITVAVALSTFDQTATQGQDYNALSETLSLSQAVRSAGVSLTILDDTHIETDETLTIRLVEVAGGRVDPSTSDFTAGQTVTILDNDRVTLGFTAEQTTVRESNQPVSVSIAVSDGSLGAGVTIEIPIAVDPVSTVTDVRLYPERDFSDVDPDGERFRS